MSKMIDAMEKLILHVINNLDTITLRRIRTRARQDLVVENGAGASIILRGDQVLINGLSSANGSNVFDIIYIGSDMQAWITRSNDGNLVIHIPENKQLQFERGT